MCERERQGERHTYNIPMAMLTVLLEVALHIKDDDRIYIYETNTTTTQHRSYGTQRHKKGHDDDYDDQEEEMMDKGKLDRPIPPYLTLTHLFTCSVVNIDVSGI